MHDDETDAIIAIAHLQERAAGLCVAAVGALRRGICGADTLARLRAAERACNDAEAWLRAMNKNSDDRDRVTGDD